MFGWKFRGAWGWVLCVAAIWLAGQPAMGEVIDTTGDDVPVEGSTTTLDVILLPPAELGDLDTVVIGDGVIHGDIRAGIKDPPQYTKLWGTGDGLVIDGVISGYYDRMGKVDVIGVERFGFSPGVGAVSAPNSIGQAGFDIWGTVGADFEAAKPSGAKPVHDPVNGYTQYLAHAFAGESVVQINGPLTVEMGALDGPAYEPTMGDRFELVKGWWFNPLFGMEEPASLQFGAEFDMVAFINGLPPLTGPGEWAAGIDQDPTYGTDVFFIQVVPEPGTLVLLISGGLGLLLLVWRRKRS
jgi:hypothetical protein